MEGPVTETLPAVSTYQQFIGGSFVDAASGETIDVENPATGQVIAKVPGSAAEDVDRAVNAAEQAYASWKNTTPQDRSLILLKIADSLESAADEIGRLESQNAGKPVVPRIDEILTCVDLFRFFAGAAARAGGPRGDGVPGRTHLVHPPRPDRRGGQHRAMELPAVHGQLEARAGARDRQHGRPQAVDPDAAERAALRRDPGRAPSAGRGQRAIGAGSAIGDELVSHPKVRMVSITGDTATGKRIAQLAAGTVKRLHLELGGKAPVIIFDDADLDLAAETLKSAGYWNAGQDCTAATRVIAGPAVYDRLRRQAQRPGPLDQVGQSRRGRRHRHGLDDREGPGREGVRDGRSARNGAEVVVGGTTPDRDGYYYEPTVIAGPDQKSEIIQDEIFGPVVTVQRFSDEEQAVTWANDTPYGLASVGVHERHRARHARGQGTRVRARLDQRALHPDVGDAARWHEAVRVGQGRIEVRA
jgi:acyl-CoA reductase-like NAD-dependent aldehyde dehydrogenase